VVVPASTSTTLTRQLGVVRPDHAEARHVFYDTNGTIVYARR
jgi:hypothetical protein